jgi:hypothetical protein
MRDRHKSHFGNGAKPAETVEFSALSLGQSEPQHCPHREMHESPLGAPMNIADVAALLGCSAWTIRQKYLPQGLPHVRASATGKFIFFREQVIAWVLKRQGKGG